MKYSDLYLVKKEDFVSFCLKAGLLMAYLGSLNPWFLWPLGALYVIPSALLIMMSFFVSNTMQNPVFSRKDYLLPLLLYIVLAVYLLFANNGNINGFIGVIFNVVVFASLFMVRKECLLEITTFISKVMACLLIISITAYFLYLAGFSLPSTNAQFGDNLYSFINYFFFLLDDRSIFIFPRFHSVFLEPGHLGTATVLLLFSQCGYWRKWYNIVLWLATFLTFSLAAYVLSVVIVFLNMWMSGKRIIAKAIYVISFITCVVVGSFFYNDGDNLVHDLILIRLEVNEEGELSGDNRVAGWFEDEYESYLQSSDILLGRDYDYTITGNSGYRLYIYENGIVGLFLVVLFYLLFMVKAESRKIFFSMGLISILCFWVRGYPLWYNVFIPLYAVLYRKLTIK